MANTGAQPLNWWRKFGKDFSFEVIAVCGADAIADFSAKNIELAAKVNSRLSREKVTITLDLGGNTEFETLVELAGRLKKDRQFALLLQPASGSDWSFAHALVDNVKIAIKKMKE